VDDSTSMFLEDDNTGFDAFYTATNRLLLRQVYAMSGDMDEAQDCIQEAYLRAWQRWPRISNYEDPAGWVRQVAFRLAVNRWHRSRNALRAWARHGPAAEVAEIGAEAMLLVQALRRLPIAQREALVMYHLADMSVDQIADQVHVPPGTVKARLARGRTRLAELLSEEVGG